MEKKQVTLALVGKARLVSTSELANYTDVWTVGTNPIEATQYICLHGESSIHPDKDITWKDYENIPYIYNMPITNSICFMLAVVAYNIEILHKSYDLVHVLASPLLAKKEMIEERPAVAYWIGYLRGIGVPVYWEGGWKRQLPYMIGRYNASKDSATSYL